MVTLWLSFARGVPLSLTSTVTRNSPGDCGTHRNLPLLESIDAPRGAPDASANASSLSSGSVAEAVNSTGDPATTLNEPNDSILGRSLRATTTRLAFQRSEAGLPVKRDDRPSILANTSSDALPDSWSASVCQSIWPSY